MRKERNQGITLIALVITIIILLILAGISIATLTGENGLLTKASTAKVETKKANAEEKVKIAVAGSFEENGEIDLNDLNTNLRQVEGLTDIRDNDSSIFDKNKIEKLPIDVVVDGYVIEIDEKGKVTLKAIKPVVTYSLSNEEPVAEGTTVTVTITASISEGEKITKITYGETFVTNQSTMTFDVTKNGYYTVTVEASNKETTDCIVKVTNIGNTEIFSDIYTETKTYTDANGRTAKIPEGFAVGESSTINMIENGLVITDQIDEKHKSTGNEFVWVPVDNIANFKTREGYSSGKRQSGRMMGEPSSDTYYAYDTEYEEYNQMYNSVTNSNNKGFYIGRYEAGKENNKVVVKKNVPAYNGVKWGAESRNPTGGAVELAKNFVKNTYTNKKKEVGVYSTLCYGIQWDATMQFFDSNYINGNCDASSYVVNSNGKGWHTPMRDNLEYKTGIDVDKNASNRVKNIYDMAGNVYEWTMEGDYYRMLRGGEQNRRWGWLPCFT